MTDTPAPVEVTRPALTLSTVTGGIDGDYVDVQFGEPGSELHHRTTLREDWAARPEAEQVAEANRRYDDWRAAIDAASNPTPPTRADLQANIDALNDQMRQTMRMRLELEDQLAAADAVVTTAVRSGDWGDPDTWDTGVVPEAGANVVIPPEHAVTIDAGVGIQATVAAASDPAPEDTPPAPEV